MDMGKMHLVHTSVSQAFSIPVVCILLCNTIKDDATDHIC